MERTYFFALGLITPLYCGHAAQASCPAEFTYKELEGLYQSVDDQDKVIHPEKLIHGTWGYRFRPFGAKRAIDLIDGSIPTVDKPLKGHFRSTNSQPNAEGKCCYAYEVSGNHQTHKTLTSLCLEEMIKENKGAAHPPSTP